MIRNKTVFILIVFILGAVLFFIRNDFIQDFMDLQKYCARPSRDASPEADIERGKGSSTAPRGSERPSAHTEVRGEVHVNRAGMGSLVELPGIGRKTALAIIEYRTEHGPFRSVEELMEVRGIGQKKLEMLRECVIID